MVHIQYTCIIHALYYVTYFAIIHSFIDWLLLLLPKVDGGYVFKHLLVSRISQKVMDGLGRNLVDKLGV